MTKRQSNLLASFCCAAAMITTSLANAQAGCEPAKAADKYPNASTRLVKIAASPTTPPFSFTDPKNIDKLTGIEIEMIEFAMNCAGLRYEFLKGPFPALIQTVMSGSSDIMVGSVVYSPARAEKVDFIAFIRSGQSVIVRNGNPRSIRTMTDLCGAAGSSSVGGSSNIAIVAQSEKCVAAGRPPVNYQASTDQDSAVRQVVNRRVDFVMDGAISAKGRVAAQPSDIEIAFTQLTDQVIGPVVRKDNEDLRKALLEGVHIMERDGKLKELLVKYDLQQFAMPIELRR
jgi:polar amino acid transport system substrate-binding protein